MVVGSSVSLPSITKRAHGHQLINDYTLHSSDRQVDIFSGVLTLSLHAKIIMNDGDSGFR